MVSFSTTGEGAASALAALVTVGSV